MLNWREGIEKKLLARHLIISYNGLNNLFVFNCFGWCVGWGKYELWLGYDYNNNYNYFKYPKYKIQIQSILNFDIPIYYLFSVVPMKTDG